MIMTNRSILIIFIYINNHILYLIMGRFLLISLYPNHVKIYYILYDLINLLCSRLTILMTSGIFYLCFFIVLTVIIMILFLFMFICNFIKNNLIFSLMIVLNCHWMMWLIILNLFLKIITIFIQNRQIMF
jgi:hypothetical protein